MSVKHPYYYFSDEAKAARHVHQYLERGEMVIPSLGGRGMAAVVERMVTSKWYNVEMIADNPGYIRVTPCVSMMSHSSWSWGCFWWISAVFVSVLLTFVLTSLVPIAMWRAQVEYAIHNNCHGMPCFTCTEMYRGFFSYLPGFPAICGKCCASCGGLQPPNPLPV
jgi:hypothetical protein